MIDPQALNVTAPVIALIALSVIVPIVIIRFRFRRWLDEGYLLELQTRYYEARLKEMQKEKNG